MQDSQCDPMRVFNFPKEFTVNCSYFVVLSYLKAGITHIVIYGNGDIGVSLFPGKLSDFNSKQHSRLMTRVLPATREIKKQKQYFDVFLPW